MTDVFTDAAQAPIADPSMDIDMELDLGPEPEIELPPVQTVSEIPRIGQRAQTDIRVYEQEDLMKDGPIDELNEEATYEKVHVRGVDELTTENIKQFSTSHFEEEAPSRVEWIDDTSANLVFSSPEVGLRALAALTQVNGEEDPSALPSLRLRSAKLLPSHPDSVLQVRSAVKTDRKQPRAHEKSRFYLMHPEHDPRERLRQELADRRRGEGGDGDYRRRRFDDRELRRRRDRDQDENVSAGMYDDQPESVSDSGRGRGGRKRRGRELFPEEDLSSGRLRNRSASPGRDTLEESGYVDPSQDRKRFRERSPRRGNQGKELFPSHDSGVRELFPNKPTSSYIRKELFPTKPSNHRRSDAFDASDDTDPLRRRITAPGDHSRLDLTVDQGSALRGQSGGLSIKGRGASARELFPSKPSKNEGKELF
ncbi:hypothetical protein N7470_008072 [Penicillium chermesinum]|nr:hypothetical protein N7470_008072 [Penicillium chermesinum]